MSTFTDNDLLANGEYYGYGSINPIKDSGVTDNFFGLSSEFAAMTDLDEFKKAMKSRSGNTNVDYWDTVEGTTVDDTDTGNYPDYDIIGDEVIENDIPTTGSGFTDEDGNELEMG